MSIHIHNLKFICKFTFIYTHVFLRIPTCAYLQMSYLKSSLAPSLSAFGQNHVKAGGQPHFPGPVEVLGEIFIHLPWCEGQRWERNVRLGISFLVSEQLQRIAKWCCWLVLPSHGAFLRPPYTNYFVICQLFPRALECPLNILQYMTLLCSKQTSTSGLWTIFLSGFSRCHHPLILFDLLLLFKANKQTLTAS